MNTDVPLVDEEREWLNCSLPWCFDMELPGGDRLGKGPLLPLTDYRVQALLDAGIDLAGKNVLEPAACEGHITVGLCRNGARVTAFDGRMSNVLKTVARCACFGYYPQVRLLRAEQMHQLGSFDIVFHSGLFYHLVDPVSHLRMTSKVAPVIALDTHTAIAGCPLVSSGGALGHWWRECDSSLAGMQPESFWLTRDSLYQHFSDCRLNVRELICDEKADCGPRSFFLLVRKDS